MAGDHLYFIRVKDGPVKIGRAGDVKARLKCLQCASPYELELVGVMPDGGIYEGTFHGLLFDHHLRGEWFEWAGRVTEAVHAAINGGDWRTALGLPEPVPEPDWREVLGLT